MTPVCYKLDLNVAYCFCSWLKIILKKYISIKTEQVN